MKLRFAVLLFLSGLSFAQGVRIGDERPPMLSKTVFNTPNVLTSEPGAVINFCNSPANAVPCTNKATTYTSATLGTACPSSTQLTIAGATPTVCKGTTDTSGNWGVWVAPGLYAYTITYKGKSTGPVPVTAGASSGGGGAWGSITGVLSAQTDLQAALDLKATVAALATKAPLVHTHDAIDIVSGIMSPSRLPPPTANTLGGVEGNGTNLTCDAGFVSNGFDSSGHINCVLDQTGGGSYVLPALQSSTLGGVKGTGSGLTCPAGNNANGFQSDGTLNCRADTITTVAGRTGAIVLAEADITNLVSDLAGKAPSSHTHTESQVTNLVSDLAGKAALVHTHSESDVTNLVADLAARALDANTVHKTGTETVNGQKTFGQAPVVLTLANGCLNITAGLIGTTTCGGSAVWGAITGTLANQTDLQNALNLKANESAVIHNTGAETISGIKEWVNQANFDDIIQVAGGYEVTSDWPAGAMTPPGVNQTKIGVDSDGHFKTCEGTAPCAIPATDAAVVHNTGTENVGGVKTFTTGIKLSGLSDGCLNITAQVVGSQACASGTSYTNLFQTNANTLTQRNAGNTQIWQLMDSYTDSSNYQGVEIGGQYIKSSRVGTGAARAFQFGIDTAAGVFRGWQISTGQDLLPYNNTSPPNIAASGARMGTIFATVYNTPLADGCVQIGTNVMGTLGNTCVTSPNDVATRTYAAGGGTAQAQTVTLSPVAATLTTGLTVRWLPTAANSGAGPTLAVSGTTAKTITKCGTTALVANDLTTTAVAYATYDGTQYQLLNPQVGACGTAAASIADPGSNGIVARTGAGTASARTITGGVGITVTNGDGVSAAPDIATDSTEQGFIAAGALTCGASTNGKMKVHTTPLQYCDNAGTPALKYAAYGDSSGNATNALTVNNGVTAASNAAAANQIWQSGGADKSAVANDFPDVKIIPAANCVNAVAGSGWSSTSTGMPAACRAGSNNFNGVLQPIPSTGGTAYVETELPVDWSTGVKPYISVYYASGANTSGTVIWTISTACTKQDGSVTDDPSWIAESAMGTQTMAAANRMWAQNAQIAGAMTNCIAGSTFYIKAVLSGTASSAINVSKMVVTVPRRPVVQAN